MNRDTIFRLAREAGLGGFLAPMWDLRKELSQFAALVAAHEREECAKAIDDSANICVPGPVQNVLQEQARCIRSRT